MSKISGGKVSAAVNYFPNEITTNTKIFHNGSNVVLINPERHGYIFHTGSKWSRFAFVCLL